MCRLFHRELMMTQNYRLGECPNLVTAIDHYIPSDGEYIFLVYPYRGQNAADFFEEQFENSRGLDESQIASILCNVCQAVEFLHKKGLAHRDISFANICVSDNIAYLIDLELLGEIGEEYAGVQGTMGYLPQQLLDNGKHIIASENDILAIGWVALQMFARGAFAWDSDAGFGSLESFLVTLPPRLWSVLKNAASQDAETRPTIRELLSDLQMVAQFEEDRLETTDE
jgi:serine/threonine protein kinase